MLNAFAMLPDSDSVSQTPFQMVSSFSRKTNGLKCDQIGFSNSLRQGQNEHSTCLFGYFSSFYYNSSHFWIWIFLVYSLDYDRRLRILKLPIQLSIFHFFNKCIEDEYSVPGSELSENPKLGKTEMTSFCRTRSCLIASTTLELSYRCQNHLTKEDTKCKGIKVLS